jgi:YVTN family beta-propeller protein
VSTILLPYENSSVQRIVLGCNVETVETSSLIYANYARFFMRNVSFHFSRTIFLLILIVNSIILISFLCKNQFGLAQQQNNPMSSSLTKQQHPIDIFFQIDNSTFSHHMAVVNGVQIHYVIGGHGKPVVLLHGWPETWYEWHKIMPALSKNYTVIVPDLRGLGDSSKPLTGYDGKTVAEDIYQLVTKLGFKTVALVGHDIGSQIAYSYAAAHPAEVKKLVVIDLSIPGFIPAGKTPLWWPLFHQTPDLPETLVQGKELQYLTWFYNNLAYNPSALTPDINEYFSHYSAPGAMRAGFEYYRAFPEDAIENQNYSKYTKLPMPVLVVGGEYYPVFGGNVTIKPALYAMKALAHYVSDFQVPNSGHWSPEENPGLVIELLKAFFEKELILYTPYPLDYSFAGIASTKNNEMYVTTYMNDTVSVIDASTNAVIGNPIPVGLGPAGIAYNTKNNEMYVTNTAGDSVSAINASANTVIGKPILVGDTPLGIAYNTKTNEMYVTNTLNNTVSVINASTNTVIKSIPVGFSPAGIAYNTKNNEMYVINGWDNNTSVINASTNAVIGNPIPVGGFPAGIAYNTKNNEMYVTNSQDNNTSVINASTNAVVGNPIPVGRTPLGIAYNIKNNEMYVTNRADNSVSVINASTNALIKSIPVGDLPAAIAYNTKNNEIYVSNTGDNSVSVINASTNAVVGNPISVDR